MRLIVYTCLGVEMRIAGGLRVSGECLRVGPSVVFVDKILGVGGVLAALAGRVELWHGIVVLERE